MRFIDRSEERDFYRLRSKGQTQAHAERATQGYGKLRVLAGGVGVILLGVVAALIMQGDPVAQPPQAAEVPQPRAFETIIAPPAPATMAVAEQEATEAPTDLAVPVENELTLAIKRAMAQDVEDPQPDSATQGISQQYTRLASAAASSTSQTAATLSAQADCVERLDSHLAPLFVQFDLGSTVITPENAELLSQISDKIITCADAYVMVAGHADSSGDDATNMALSWERADRTVNRLVALGVNPDAVEAVGFGARAPLSQGSSEDDGIDRRVDFRVLHQRGDKR